MAVDPDSPFFVFARTVLENPVNRICFIVTFMILAGALAYKLVSRAGSPRSPKKGNHDNHPALELENVALVNGYAENQPGERGEGEYEHIPLAGEFYNDMPVEASIEVSKEFYKLMKKRRSVRFFSSRPVPRVVIENAIRTAGTSPSGANQQQWTFVVVEDPGIKREIRIAAEAEERKNYGVDDVKARMNNTWLQDLAPLGTDWRKPFLEVAPYLIVVMKQTHGFKEDGSRQQHYYFERSCGIATGMLISALHVSGLVTLTHTPTPMQFLAQILNRPDNEKPYLLLPVGYPASTASVPKITKKSLEEIMSWI